MDSTSFTYLLGISFAFGIVGGIMLVAYEDGVAFGLYRRIKCKFGNHTHKVGRKGHINLYYCARCKKPRNHPSLKVIDGGRKDWDIGSFKL
jgi:hypothetical protein